MVRANKHNVPLHRQIDVLPTDVVSTFHCLKCSKAFHLDVPQVALSSADAAVNKDGDFATWCLQPTITNSSSNSGAVSPRTEAMPAVSMLFDVTGSVELAQTLFDRLSCATHQDYPRCSDCCEAHVDEMEAALLKLDGLRSAYQQLLLSSSFAESKINNDNNDDEASRLDEELLRLERDHAELRSAERELDEALAHEEQRAAHLRADAADVAEREAQYWKHVTQCGVDEAEIGEEAQYLDHRLKVAKAELTRLLSTSTLDEAFHMQLLGHAGLVNGMKLTKLPAPEPDQAETNAAWSYLVLLLQVLADAAGTSFTSHTLMPKGNWSSIEARGPSSTKSVLELHLGAGGWFPSSRHDKALVGYLSCVDELVQDLLRKCPGVGEPPAVIKSAAGLIGGMPIRVGKSNAEQWSQAIRSLLLVLKWCIRAVTLLKSS
eukprot:PhM_4_TR13000/c0_g1_i1/m.40584/K08334/BECN, VPS30, ATG6; beclin